MITVTTLPLFAQEDALESYRTGRNAEARGFAAESERNYNNAYRICMREIESNAATSDTYAVLTWTLQRQKKYGDVITWGQRGLALRADDWRIIETMGEAYFYLENYTSSMRFMQRYVNAMPQGASAATAFFFIGEIFRVQGKYRHADIAYTTALQLSPDMPLWWYRLGLARENAGDTNEALAAYERSSRLDPSYRLTTEALSRVRSAIARG
jgi:tetratricopeptide (TPR) repeat protein